MLVEEEQKGKKDTREDQLFSAFHEIRITELGMKMSCFDCIRK